MSFRSVYDSVWDVVVFGAGYAGFAAALALRRAGKRALLVDRRSALLVESGWAFADESGDSADPLWREWVSDLRRRGAAGPGWIDGAVAEVSATELVRTRDLPVLYYAAPVAAEFDDGGRLAAVVLAAKSGPRRLRARRWIDATDVGELAAIVSPGWIRPVPRGRSLRLFFRHAGDKVSGAGELAPPAGIPAGARLHHAPGRWTGESVLGIELPGDFPRPREAWLPALRTLHSAAPELVDGAVLTHGSVVPLDAFPVRTDVAPGLPANVLFAGANGTRPAEKFDAGLRAADASTGLPPCVDHPRADAPLPEPDARESLETDVVVAGLGTGGALAAISAARGGARVFAFDAMPFPGGVGSGGGIHVYYFGVKGGLQEEVDGRVRALMPLFGTPAQIGGFHPDAKKLVLDEMLAEAGVTVVSDANFHAVRVVSGRVEELALAAPSGPVRVRAAAWIDATGDGDLAAGAGAAHRLGRLGDGLLHAYGQSSGRASLHHGSPRLQIVNFDAGFCDPTDEQDLTRARLLAVSLYLQDKYDAERRPTYVAPVIGLRQSRHIETDYVLSLDDLIGRRRFPDAVGYTGCHYDNHARDYEFETDEAAFWVWACQQWYGRLACEIPYRSLLPRDLKNLVLACRAVGVSEEAHHSFRMQRDMQRIGEVAGSAAALAVREKRDFRDIPFDALRRRLLETGAVLLAESPDRSFGHQADPDYFEHAPGRLDDWLAELRGGPATAALWHLYRAGESAHARVAALLDDPDDAVSWRAACILAMWGDARAEPRLLRAIRTRENDKTRDITRPQQEWFYVPRWYAAVTLLKRCITRESLPLLELMAPLPSLPLNIRNAVALAVEALANRTTLSAEERGRAVRLLDQLTATPPPRAVRDPQGSTLEEPVETEPAPEDWRPAREDYTWQLHFAIARARIALGLPVQEAARVFSTDPRRIVRRAFARLPSATPRPASAPPAREPAPEFAARALP